MPIATLTIGLGNHLTNQAQYDKEQKINELAGSFNNPSVWSFNFNCAGSAVPNGTTLKNDLGAGFATWTRIGAGSYQGSFNGSVFPTPGKIFATPGGFVRWGTSANFSIGISFPDAQRILVEMQNTAGTFSELAITNFPLKAEVFS